ncbi:MAG TPA: thiamine-phosphate kinase [Candidatus Cybelea sp.]|nr:thiamine-phosphate kinase [Candidatus Cybelea sp.]
MDRETQLIKRIARAVASSPEGTRGVRTRVGIGDDAAVLTPGRSTEWALSCDAFMQGVHFLVKSYPPDSVGYKSLVRATSDLAAMGATPRLFLLTLALPERLTGNWLDGFLRGMGRAARLLGMELAGGDTTKSASVAISVTVLGEVGQGLAVRRSGARPGDVIYVSGTLGRAQLGLELAKNAGPGMSAKVLSSRTPLLQPHLYPKIRVGLGTWLASHKVASAMIDLSDGLSSDLARLCEASGAAARLQAERIPCVKLPAAAKGQLWKPRLDAFQMALHGGEDYELLFTVPRKKVELLRRAPNLGEITAIGEIERGDGITLVGVDGRGVRLHAGGWDPFRRKSSKTTA